MKRLAVLIVLLVLTGTATAHWLGKSFEFHRFEHLIEVRLDQNNELHVLMDNVEIGTRTDFCREQ